MTAFGASTALAADAPTEVDDVLDDAEAPAIPGVSAGASGVVVQPASVPKEKQAPGVLAAKTVEPPGDWGIAPVPWRGQLLLTAGLNSYAEAPLSKNFSESFNWGASSYIWEPWFLPLTLGGGLMKVQSRAGDSGSDADAASVRLGIRLLPGTRKAVDGGLGYSMGNNESRSGSQTTSSGTRSVNMSLSHMMVPIGVGPTTSLYANGMKTTASSVGSESSTSSSTLGATITVPIKSENPQSFATNFNFTRSSSEPQGSESSTIIASATHGIYLEEYVMNIASDASLSRNEGGPPGKKSLASVLMTGATMDWIPSDDYPLKINGNTRLFQGRTIQDGGAENIQTTATLYGGANYPLSSNWSVGGALQSTAAKSETGASISKQMINSLSSSANWRGDGIQKDWGDWKYNFSYGGTGSGSLLVTTDSEKTVKTPAASLSTSLGNALARRFDARKGERRQLSFSQVYSLSRPLKPTGPMIHSVNHSANFSTDTTWGRDTTMATTVVMSDSRSFGETATDYQSLTGGVTGNAVLGPYSSLGTTVNTGFSRQGATPSAPARWGGSGGGGVTYNHTRFADVSGLVYRMSYALVLKDLVQAPEQGGDAALSLDHSFSQSWSWRMGLLGWRFEQNSSYTSGGTPTHGVYLSVFRDFSGML